MTIEPLQVAATCNECGQIIPAGMRARIYERRDGSRLVFHADRAICKGQAQAGAYRARPKAQVGASRQAGTYQAPQAQAQAPQASQASQAGLPQILQSDELQALIRAVVVAAADLPHRLFQVEARLGDIHQALEALVGILLVQSGEQAQGQGQGGGQG